MSWLSNRPSLSAFWLLCLMFCIPVFIMITSYFQFGLERPVLNAVWVGLKNSFIGSLLGLPIFLSAFRSGRASQVKIKKLAPHLLGACSFGAVWLSLLFLISWTEKVLIWGEAGSEWPSVAVFSWYAGLGFYLYLALAISGYLIAQHQYRNERPIHSPIAPLRSNEPIWPSIFLNRGSITEAVDISAIQFVCRESDYLWVQTNEHKYLTTGSLKNFAARYSEFDFVFANRSVLVNLNHIEQILPADERRVILCLNCGKRIITSRAGTRRIKRLFLSV